MEGMLVLIAIVALAALVLGPVGFFVALGARRRADETNRLIRSLEGRLAQAQLQIEGLQRTAPERPPAEGPTEAPEAEPEPKTGEEAAASAVPRTGGDAMSAEPGKLSEDEGHEEPVAGESADTGPEAETAATGGRKWDWPGQTGASGKAETAAVAARRGPGLEERLGTRWTVWVGGVALAFGAVLLVRYAIDQGFFGPGMRVILGLLLAAVLIGAGERLRRQEQRDAVAVSEGTQQVPGAMAFGDFAPPSIPAMLTAAGTVAAFGSIYAAHALYHFIGAAFAFILLGLAAVATMFAAALHGPMLAGLGLAAAMAVPLLVSSNSNNAWPVVLYLAVAIAAAYGLARLRRWLWLAIAAVAGGGLWALLFLASIHGVNGVSNYHAALAHLMIQSAMAIYVLAWEPYRGNAVDGKGWLVEIPTKLAAGIALLTLVVLATASMREFSALWFLAAAAIAAMLAITELRIAPALLSVIGGAATGVGALVIWPWSQTIPGSEAVWLAFDTLSIPPPASPGAFITFAILVPGVISGAALWKVLRNGDMRLFPVSIFAGTAVLTPMLALLATYLRYITSGQDMLFAAIAGGLAATYAVAAQVFRNGVKDHQPFAWELGQGITASAAIAALSIGLTMALDGGTLTIALGLAALGAAIVAVRLDITALRWCVAGLAVVLAARFLWEPRIATELGPTPVFNWLLAGYGLPAVCFGLAVRMMRRAFGEDRPVQIAQAMTILCAALLVYFEIRHFAFGPDLLRASSGLVEQGLFAIASLGFAIVLMRMDARRASPIFHYASLGFGIASGLISLFGLGLAYNPLFAWRGEALAGGVVFNPLLLSYLLPAGMALLLGRLADGIRPAWYVMGARIVAVALAFAYISLQVRRVFQGPSIGMGHYTRDGEWYTYSAVWLAFGICLLAYGLWRKSVEVRIASAIFIVLSVIKVFLFDLAGLDGILRALSFIGLGGVLIGIGLVYQKYVFRRATPDAAATDGETDSGR
jgi:uncharacterized membrane protein